MSENNLFELKGGKGEFFFWMKNSSVEKPIPMLASMVWEFCINPFQALIETISARETPENSWNGDKSELQGFKDTRTGKLHHKMHVEGYLPPCQDSKEVTGVPWMPLYGLWHAFNLLFSWRCWRQLDFVLPGETLGVGRTSKAIQWPLSLQDPFSFCLERCTGWSSVMPIMFSQLHHTPVGH